MSPEPAEKSSIGFEFEFNDEQQAAIEKILEWYKAGKGQYFGLFGYAGTGKSSLLQEVCHRLNRHRDDTVMMAPTHKALGVLANMSHSHGGSKRYSYATLHSALQLRPKKIEGKQVFVRDRPDKWAPIQDYTMAVLDECSMVDSELWGFLEAEVRVSSNSLFNQGMRVVVMGDHLQLPPVSEPNKRSPSFDVEDQVTLNEVMRFAGVVGECVDTVRENIHSPAPLLPPDASDSMGEIVNMRDRDMWMDDIIEHAKAGVDLKALAWTNRSVDRINKKVREAIFGRDVDPYIVGERLVAVEAYVVRDNVILQTEDDVEILEAEETTWGDFDCWKLRVRNLQTNTVLSAPIYILGSRDRVKLGKRLSRLAKEKKWGEFWPLKERFAILRPPYATTVHKSQGSTYERVYVLQSDVMSAARRDPFLRNRLMYVAYSRTSHGLILCHA